MKHPFRNKPVAQIQRVPKTLRRYDTDLKCPECHSTNLKIRRATGFERIMLLFTSKRKFCCVGCGLGFRAADRRSISREADNLSAATHTGPRLP
jgi:rubredoxin